MAGPTVNAYVIPTGGAVRLDFPDYLQPASGVGNVTIYRAVSGVAGLSSFVQIYTGLPPVTWLDVGDLMAGPLLSGALYVWNVADGTGATQTAPIMPVSAMRTKPDGLTQLLLRLLQGAVNGIKGSKPEGISDLVVTTAMPQGGLRATPFMVVNLDLIQQEETQIGQDVEQPDLDGTWTLWVNATRVWRVSVFSRNPSERDFYRDSVLAWWRVWHQSVFTPIGLNVHHRFQASSGTDVSEGEGTSPGFYYADIMLELDGVFDVAVLDSYGLIEVFDVTVDILHSDQVIEVTSIPGSFIVTDP